MNILDITERKQAEEALRESEERYRLFVETLPYGISVHQDGKIVFANPAAARLFGAQGADELIGKPIKDLIHPATWEVACQRIGRMLKGETGLYPAEDRYVRLDGSAMPVEVIAASFTHQGRPAVQVIVQDITERKQREEDIRRRLAELEAVNRIKTALRSAQKLNEMLPLLLQETLSVMETSSGAIWLYDDLSGTLFSKVARGWLEIISGASVKPGEGIIGAAFNTGEVCQSPEFTCIQCISLPMDNRIPAGWGGACIPISTAQEVIGVFIVSVEQPRELSSVEISLLVTLAEIAGNAIHRMRLHELTEQNLRRMTTLRTLDQAISSIMDLRITLEILITQIVSELGVDAALVLLLNPHTNMLEFSTGHGFRGTKITGLSLQLGEDYAGRTVLERKNIQILDLTQAKYTFTKSELIAREGFVAYYGIPLIAKGQVKGILEVFLRSRFEASAEWLEFLEMLAGQAAIAIDNATLFEDQQRSTMELIRAYETTLEGWSRTLDLRDKETEGHSHRVTEMTLSLAQYLGIEEADMAHIKRGTILHDIGKMGIPDSILLKPSSLTPEEWKIMKLHPTYAYELLFPIDYLKKALDIPYCHHEKWDGTGYPRGLKGEQIPLAARIFAVVDVWDAVTSDRPYRAALSKEKAIEYIRTESGKHFDPHVLELFLQWVG